MHPILRYITLPVCTLLLLSTEAQWQPIASGTTDSLSAITFVDGRFLVAGENGRFLRSLDNGVSFTATAGYTTTMAGNAFDHLFFYDSLSGYGTSTMTCCALQRTTDGGETWTASNLGPLALPFNDSDLVVFRIGPGITFASTGQLMHEPLFPVFADIDSICSYIVPGNCDTSVFAGDTTIQTNSSWGWTLSSNDRGDSYYAGAFPYAYYPYTADVIGGDTLAYLDYAMQLIISANGGETWTSHPDVPSYGSWIDPGFDMITSRTGAVVDDQGHVNLTEDAGATWAEVPTPTTANLHDILFIDPTHVLALGDHGTILASSDGGYTWIEEESGTTSRLQSLAVSGNAVIAVGNDGVILRRFPAYDGMSTGLDPANVDQLAIFPNPASASINVQTTGEHGGVPVFTATDALGRAERLPAITGGNGRWVLDIAHLTEGAYVLELLQNGVAAKRMFIIAH